MRRRSSLPYPRSHPHGTRPRRSHRSSSQVSRSHMVSSFNLYHILWNLVTTTARAQERKATWCHRRVASCMRRSFGSSYKLSQQVVVAVVYATSRAPPPIPLMLLSRSSYSCRVYTLRRCSLRRPRQQAKRARQLSDARQGRDLLLLLMCRRSCARLAQRRIILVIFAGVLIPTLCASSTLNAHHLFFPS